LTNIGKYIYYILSREADKDTTYRRYQVTKNLQYRKGGLTHGKESEKGSEEEKEIVVS